jgi:hypothetical protein
MPDKKMSAGSRETCSAKAGKEPTLSNTAAATATRVGPISPAIVFDVLIGALGSDMLHHDLSRTRCNDCYQIGCRQIREPRQYLSLGGWFVLAARDCCLGRFEPGSRVAPVAERLVGGTAAAAQSKRTLGNR